MKVKMNEKAGRPNPEPGLPSITVKRAVLFTGKPSITNTGRSSPNRSRLLRGCQWSTFPSRLKCPGSAGSSREAVIVCSTDC